MTDPQNRAQLALCPPANASMSADPTLQLLLDEQRLRGMVQRPVRAVRVRPKARVGHQAALVGPDGQPWGWIRVLVGRSREKQDKLLTRARRGAGAAQVGSLILGELDASVLWGPWFTDPALVKSLERIRPSTAPEVSGLQVLRHNPGRRLVLRDGNQVWRVTSDSHSRSVQVATQLLSLGVPVNAPVEVCDRDAVHLSRWPWLPGRDLGQAPQVSELSGAGGVLAQLHELPVGPLVDVLDGSPRGWREQMLAVDQAVAQLHEVAPGLGARAQELRTALPRWVPASRDVVVHGDLSLDQFLAGADGSVHLGDLDRVALGPVEVDLASLRAVALLLEHDIDPLLQAWADTVQQELSVSLAGLAPWTASSLLQRCSQYWRSRDAQWSERTSRLLELAAQELRHDARGGSWRVPHRVQGCGDAVTITRAWPDKMREHPTIAVEGRDATGTLRAARLDTTGRARLLPPGTDRRLPALESASSRGELVVHRAGKRAVLACPTREAPSSYVKVVRAGQGAGVARAAEHGARVAAAVGLAAPSVLAHGDDTVTMSVLAGVPLHGLSTDPRWEGIWQEWAQRWQLLQQLPVDGALPVHGCAAEAGVLRTWQTRCAQTGLLDHTPWPRRMAELADELAAAGDRRLVTAHRDLHDKQLLYSSQGLGVLDFDTVSLAAPELDLANLAAHASLREAQGLWGQEAALVVTRAAQQVARAMDITEDRWRRAELATVARLAGVYAFRPQWRTLVLDWAERCWG
ncbi:hypothetical protein ACTQ49_05570 [Luteococcus sp. Sow4_B9]|uniref:hypothetical protein n=1 Tax=Luteococcus sp. Sow4_B9 TaxID=3438792 RepID=UPI003F9B7677